ncbi:hypothetical protein LCGC14_2993950, partial [marine sediment metagenome]
SVISAVFPHLKQLCLMPEIRLIIPSRSMSGLKLGD